MFRTLRVRLALWFTVVFAMTSGVVAWVVYEYVERTLADRLDQSLQSEMIWIVSRFDRTLAVGEPIREATDDIFEHASQAPFKEYIEIWRPVDSLAYRSPNLGPDTLRVFLLEGDVLGVPVTVTKFRQHDIRMLVHRDNDRMILIAMPTEIVTAPANELFRILFWLGPIVILVAAIGGVYVARRSLATLNRIVDAARRITADRLHERIPPHNVEDEIGAMVLTFNEMISRLEKSFERMKEFSADASHELRTPLSVLRSQLESALRSDIPADELRTVIADCLDETLHMSAIVEDLFLLSKGDSGTSPLKREPVSLRTLLQDMHEESTILASAKRIAVTLTAPEDVMILGDLQRLRQMMLNMIDNAIKYNRVEGEIRLGLARRGETAVITVEDTGIGVPQEETTKIFDRFYRVDRARPRDLGGAGLGLAITKWIVEAHGGSITVRSELNRGTTFEIALPAAPGAGKTAR